MRYNEPVKPSQLAKILVEIAASELGNASEELVHALEEDIYYSILSYIKEKANDENMETSSDRVQQKKPTPEAHLSQSRKESCLPSNEEIEVAYKGVIRVRRTTVTDYYYTQNEYKALPSLTMEKFNGSKYISHGHPEGLPDKL